nr:hypothetical protein [Tanacetum cinerariifolium]
SMRIEQYLTHIDYALWEVIVNGAAPASIASISGGAESAIPPKTTKQKIARRNELKAKSTPLLVIPDEHLLKFHGIKDEKTLGEEDANLKLLRSIPPAWNTHTLIMRNKSDLDTLSMYDLYNDLKVYEAEIKGQSSSSLNSQNVAFVSLDNTSSTNEAVNTAHNVSAASSQGQASASTYVDDVMFSFFVNQSNSPQLNNEDLEQIDTDDLEEMDLKWYKAGEGYHAVPPPYTGNFMPLRPDLSFAGLADLVFKSAISETETSTSKTSKERIKNQINHRAKIIKCNNGTKFKNSKMNQFYQMKGIKREFSVARTPQQNRVAKRKNRTLIENRVLVTKPHKKTPYELLIGRSPNLEFMKPFGCPVTILNTIDHLGKFERKADEGFLVGYSVNSKAFRVFNSRTKRVKENLHIKFLENKPNVAGRGPKWLFDIDSLTNSMNYEQVTAGNQTNNDAGIEINANAGKAEQEKASDHEYILLPFMPSSTQSSNDKDAGEVPEKGNEGVSKRSGIDDQEKTDGSSQDVDTVEPSINTASTNINTGSLNINIVGSNDPSMLSLEETGIFNDVYDDREVGAEANTNKLELLIVVSPIPTTRVQKDHPKE